MKKKTLILIAALSFAAAASAQEAKTMYVMKNGAVAYQSVVSDIDSIIFYKPDPCLECTQKGGVYINDVCWATRNLDTGGVFVENPEDYGALYQWGRKADGHESRTSGTTTTLATTDTPGHSDFILTDSSPWDWRNPQNDILWNSGTEIAPVKTANDPCPAGWRVPTQTELASLGSGEWQTTPAGRIFSNGSNTLFLPAAGYHSANSSALYNVGSNGAYWSSTVNSTNAYNFYFSSSSVSATDNDDRGLGFSVRCVAE